SLEVRPGEVVGLLGPNGAGKTTLIRICCGLVRPTAGRVAVAGADPSRDRFRAARSVGYMPQRAALYDDLSAADNLRFFATMQGWTGARRTERVEQALSDVSLGDRRDDRVFTLS